MPNLLHTQRAPRVLDLSAGRLGRVALLVAARAESVGAEYQGNTARALAAGVFGSPF
jgi:2-hydroxychromene-2-carboxylate isomerase